MRARGTFRQPSMHNAWYRFAKRKPTGGTVSTSKHIGFDIAFAIISVVFLIVGIFASPLFNVPDEESHFCRAYQVSEGCLVSYADPNDPTNGLMGGVLPTAVAVPDELARTHTHADVADYATRAIDNSDRSFVSFRNTALYSPVSYTPQALGIAIARLLTGNVATLAYAGRFMNWLAAVAIIFLCLRFLPTGKPIAFALALLPMMQQELFSLATDGISFALCLAIVTCALYWREQNGTMGLRHLALIAAIVLALSQFKIVYVPICLALFLIPVERFGGKARYVCSVACIAALGIAGCLGWLSISSNILAHEALGTGVDPDAQMAFVKTNPFAVVAAMARTFAVNLPFYLESSTADYLAWMGIRVNPLIVILYLLVLAAATISGTEPLKRPFTLRTRLALAGIALLICALIYASLYLQYTPVGSSMVGGTQGRYFIPLYLLIMLACMSNKNLLPAKLGSPLRWLPPASLILDLATGFTAIAHVM